MTTFEIPTIDVTHGRLLDDYRGRFPTFDFARLSDNWKRLRVLAGGVGSLHYHQEFISDELLPDTAKGKALDRLGLIWGLPRRGATPARKADALRVFGTLASAVTLGDLLTGPNGLSYQANENAVIPAGLFIDIDIVAVDVGSATQLIAPQTLTFDVPPAGIDAAAELQLDLDEDGVDQESDAVYRARILNKIQQPEMGGNQNDFENFAFDSDDSVEAAFVYPLRRGFGSVDLAALHAGSGTVRPLTAPERTALFDDIEILRPVSYRLFRVLEVTTTEADLETTVQGIPSVVWDWNDAAPPTVTSFTGGTRVLKMSARPSDMAKGDRIIIKTILGDGDGANLVVEALGPLADEVVITALTVPTVVPVVTDIIYSGSDLADQVRSAHLAEIDGLGPGIGAFGVGNWRDSVQPGRLEAIAFTFDTVRNVTVVAPAVPLEPAETTFPADTTVDLFVPGEIIVRRQH